MVQMIALSGEPALIEKVLLLSRHCAAEDWIAVGKPPEVFDDVAMALGKRGVGLVKPANQFHGAVLVGDVFGMTERQIVEAPQLTRHFQVMTGHDGAIGSSAGLRIARIHPWRAAKRVARKLVEQQDQRQGARWRRQPAVQLAARCGLVRLQKALAESTIEIRILGEPQLAASVLPEYDDVVGCCWLRGCVAAQIPSSMEFLLDEPSRLVAAPSASSTDIPASIDTSVVSREAEDW